MCLHHVFFNILPSRLDCFQPFKQAALLGIGLIKLSKPCKVACEEGETCLVISTCHWIASLHAGEEGISSRQQDRDGTKEMYVSKGNATNSFLFLYFD